MTKVKYDTTPVPRQDVQHDLKITDAQRSYLKDLLEKKDMTGVDEQKLDLVWKALRISEDPEEIGITRSQASKLLEWALGRRDKPRAEQDLEHAHHHRAEFPDVPAGRYAIDNEEGILRFYTVDRPTQGRWKGWTFVSVWASDEKHRIKGAAQIRVILQKISDDGIQAAAERFGQEIGSCAICGRTLTDPNSIAIGIGPICRGKTGWY